MFKNLLLVGDLSEHSLHAARTAGEMARAMNASSLCIATAFPPVHVFLGEPNFDKVSAARLIEAEAVAADGKATKICLPSEIGCALATLGAMSEVFRKGSDSAVPDLKAPAEAPPAPPLHPASLK